MSAIRRSPKIPLSPSSPPETGLKRRRESDDDTKRPPSPEYMSVATKSYVSSYGHTSNMDETASRSSPRSPASSSSYNNNNATQRTSQPYSTPSSSVSGIPGLSMAEDPDQHRDKRQRMDPARDGDESMEAAVSVLPTNHDRSTEVVKEEAATPILRETQTQEEIGETLDQLQKDMGEPFLLCRSKVAPTRPDPSQHLLGMYGLTPLIKNVIRNDPVTGEKINKLRKSYEGQIKTFALSGKNRPVQCERIKDPPDQEEPGPLRKAIGSEWRGLQSDDDWQKNNPIPEIKVDDEFRTKLRRAMQIQPGAVRNSAEWEQYLGSDKPRVIAPPPQMPAPQQRIPNGVPPPRTREAVDLKRHTRGKKRSYDDSSFIGYGDGYSDVEGDESFDPEEDGGGRRKRRKASFGFGLDR